jgi:hypothetical protein
MSACCEDTRYPAPRWQKIRAGSAYIAEIGPRTFLLEFDENAWIVSYEYHHKTVIAVCATLGEAKMRAYSFAERGGS